MSWLRLAILGIALCAVVGCSGGGEKANEGREVVTAIIPLSGPVSTYGESLRKGFDIAAAEFADAVEVQYEDSKANPADAIAVYRKVSNNKANRYYLGDATSGVCLALAPQMQESGHIYMISIATADGLADVGDYIFRNAPPNSEQSISAAAFVAENLGVKRVAIVRKLSQYGNDLAVTFENAARDLGLEIVYDDAYEPNTRDFTEIVQNIKKSDAEMVFLPGNYEETAALLKRARELRYSGHMMGTDGAYSPQLIALAGAAAEEFYLTMMPIDRDSKMYAEFKSKYRDLHGDVPDVFAAYGYEGARLLFSAIVSAGEAGVEGVKSSLMSSEHETLSGKMRFGDNGEFNRGYGVYVVRDGRFSQY